MLGTMPRGSEALIRTPSVTYSQICLPLSVGASLPGLSELLSQGSKTLNTPSSSAAFLFLHRPKGPHKHKDATNHGIPYVLHLRFRT